MDSKAIFKIDLEKEQVAQKKLSVLFDKKKNIGGSSLEACG
jgi:hypothetical protein